MYTEPKMSENSEAVTVIYMSQKNGKREKLHVLMFLNEGLLRKCFSHYFRNLPIPKKMKNMIDARVTIVAPDARSA